MSYALSTGGGKDATLALHRARARGLEVPWAYSIHEGNTGRIRFHGTPASLVRAQAEALGLELLQAHTHPEDFESVYLDILDRWVSREAEGVVYGNIHLADVRGWYEERTRDRGLDHQEPLWGEDPGNLVREFIRAGYRAVVVGVHLEVGDPDWLGEELDERLVSEIEEAGADSCGERGEYHTFVWDGPLFRWPVPFRLGSRMEMDGHRFVDLTAPGREGEG